MVSVETRLKMSKAQKGRKHSDETKMKISIANKGRKVTEEARQKQSKKMKGKHSNQSTEFKKGMTPWNKDISRSEQTKKKISEKLNKYWSSEISEKNRKELSKTRKDKHFSPATEFKKGCISPNTGKHLSKETRDKLSIKAKLRTGKKNSFYGKHHSKATRERWTKIRTGMTPSDKTREKMCEARAKRIFPKKDTVIEKKIQGYLNNLGIEVATHKLIYLPSGAYQCDAFLPSLNLVIECDGNYWHNYPNGNGIDHIRATEIEKENINLIRLWEQEIKNLTLEDFAGIIEEPVDWWDEEKYWGGN